LSDYILGRLDKLQKKLLVTGGAGFIGSNFALYWLNTYSNDKVIVLDALTYAGNKANLAAIDNNPNFTFIHGDICNTALVEKILSEHNIDTLVHFAAESHVDRSITGPDAFIETNIMGTYSLLKASKRIWIDEPKAKGLALYHIDFIMFQPMKYTEHFQKLTQPSQKKPLMHLIRLIQPLKLPVII